MVRVHYFKLNAQIEIQILNKLYCPLPVDGKKMNVRPWTLWMQAALLLQKSLVHCKQAQNAWTIGTP